MLTGKYNWIFKRGTTWDISFKIEGIDLTAATVAIVITLNGSGSALFDSATDGTLTKTLVSGDTVILWTIPYTATGNATIGQAYEYDVQVTVSGRRDVYIEGKITVTRNLA